LVKTEYKMGNIGTGRRGGVRPHVVAKEEGKRGTSCQVIAATC